MPKVSAAGTERVASWCRENGGPELTPDQAKELLERAVRLFYLAYRSEASGDKLDDDAERGPVCCARPLGCQRRRDQEPSGERVRRARWGTGRRAGSRPVAAEDAVRPDPSRS